MDGLFHTQLFMLIIGMALAGSISERSGHIGNSSSTQLFGLGNQVASNSSSPNPRFPWVAALKFTLSRVSSGHEVAPKYNHVTNRRNVPVESDGFINPPTNLAQIPDTAESISSMVEISSAQRGKNSFTKTRKISPKFEHLNSDGLQFASEASPYLGTIVGVVLGIMIVLLFCFIIYANHYREIPVSATNNRPATRLDSTTVSSLVEQRARYNSVDRLLTTTDIGPAIATSAQAK